MNVLQKYYQQILIIFFTMFHQISKNNSHYIMNVLQNYYKQIIIHLFTMFHQISKNYSNNIINVLQKYYKWIINKCIYNVSSNFWNIHIITSTYYECITSES